MLDGAKTGARIDWRAGSGITADGIARRLCFASLGAAGTVLAHMAGYQLAYPDPHHRSLQLAHAGHAYWETAVTIALFSAIVTLLGEVAIANARPDRRAAFTQPALLPLWNRLALGQVVVFAVVEVAERALHGVNPSAWTEPSFWAALPVMFATAWLGALLLRAAVRIGAKLARRVSRDHRRDSDTIWFPPARDIACTRLLRRSIGSRAPPLPLVV